MLGNIEAMQQSILDDQQRLSDLRENLAGIIQFLIRLEFMEVIQRVFRI